jgi:hypothetical protein
MHPVSTFSPETIAQTDSFIDEVRNLRARNPQANAFFQQFTEFCTDFEAHAREVPEDTNRQHWLLRLGRMLALMDHDPYPGATYTHPENTDGAIGI